MAKDALSLAWLDMRRRRFATTIKRLEAKKDIYDENFEYYLTLGIACLYVGDIGASSSYFQLARRIKLTDTRLLLGQAAIAAEILPEPFSIILKSRKMIL